MDNIFKTSKEREQFEEVLSEINKSEGTWQERKEQLVSELSDDAVMDLQEIAGWFDE